MKVKKESEKADLKLNIQKTKIMASGPITSWQIDEEKNGNSGRLYFLRQIVTADSDYSHEIKGHFLLGRKAITNLLLLLLLLSHFSHVHLCTTP